jgi:hypothetical protein
MCFRQLFKKNATHQNQQSAKQPVAQSEENLSNVHEPDISECRPYSLAGGMRLVAHQPDHRSGVKHIHRLFDLQGSITVVCTHPDGPELKMIEQQITRYLEEGLR